MLSTTEAFGIPCGAQLRVLSVKEQESYGTLLTNSCLSWGEGCSKEPSLQSTPDLACAWSKHIPTDEVLVERVIGVGNRNSSLYVSKTENHGATDNVLIGTAKEREEDRIKSQRSM